MSSMQTTLNAQIVVECIRRALERKGYPINGEDVRYEVVNLTDFDPMGVTPPVSISERDPRASQYIRMVELQADGKWKLLTDWARVPDLAPKEWQVRSWK